MLEFISVSIFNLIAKILKFTFEIGTSYFVDKETYGYFAILLSYMLIFTRISVFGIPNLMIRELSKKNNLKYKSYLLFNSIFIVISIVIVGAFLIDLLKVKYLSNFYEIPLIVFFSSLLFIYSVFLRVNGNIKLWIFFQDISWYIFYFIGLSIALLFFSLDINLILKIYLFSILFSFISIIIFIKYKYKYTFISKISFDKIKYIISQSFPILFTGLTYLILARIDVIMLGNYVDLSLVGEYNIIARVTIQTLFVYQVISSYFYPRLAKKFAKKEDYNEIAKYVTKFVFVSFLSVFVLNIILFILIKYFNLFNILKIIHIEEMFYVFIIFAITQIIYSTIGIYGYILLYIHKQKVEYINNIVILIIGISLNFILIPQYGVIGAATASIIAILVGNFLEMLEVKFFTNVFFLRF